MNKPLRFGSNYAEDILLILLAVFGTLGLYLVAAYFFISVL